MKTIISSTIFLAVMISCLIFANRALGQNDMQKAQDLMAMYEYPKAIELYTSSFKVNAPAITDLRNLAECYLMINNTTRAMETMGRVVENAGATAGDVFRYAMLLKSEGLYDDAIKQLEQYKLLIPQKEESANLEIFACEEAKKWVAKPEYIDVANMTEVNSENSDFGLVPVGKIFLLTSDRRIRGDEEIYSWTGNPYLKLYSVQADEQGMPTGQFRVVNSLNYKYHNGPGIMDDNDGVLYYTRTEMVRVKKKPINPDPTSWYDHSTAADYTNRLEIFSADYGKSGGWSGVKAFAYNKAEEYSVGHPTLNSASNIMYFVSDMPGGYGGSDIYYCTKRDDGTWSQPHNAGNSINTSGKEVFPFLDDDGTLYFSSDGHPGMGGLDLFRSKGSKNSWSEPENLKSPMNSPRDDFSIFYTETGKSGYFSSNREGGKGSDDIYSFVASPPINLILAVVTKEKFDDNTTAILDGVDVNIKNTGDNNPLPFVSGNPGIFYATANCNGEYEVKGSRDGYFASVQTVKMPYCITKQDTVEVELLLSKIKINVPIVLENIYYDFDKWFIRPDAEIELNKLLKILVDNPDIKIELGSHTDCRGSDRYNEVLSQKRAESAVNYIIGKGIDKERITAKGYGEKVLINNCSDGVECTEEDHQFNRRTEFKVTGFIKGRGNVDIKSEKGTNVIVNPKPGTKLIDK
ncbi:MAG TPA: OmpA family protein [Bacteroidales bacterium]|nr:OmpA family protein [Bacteroidales bacterium]